MRTGLNEYKDVGNVKIGGLHHSPFEGEGQRAIWGDPRVASGINPAKTPNDSCSCWNKWSYPARVSLVDGFLGGLPSYLPLIRWTEKRRHGRFFREIPGRI